MPLQVREGWWWADGVCDSGMARRGKESICEDGEEWRTNVRTFVRTSGRGESGKKRLNDRDTENTEQNGRGRKRGKGKGESAESRVASRECRGRARDNWCRELWREGRFAKGKADRMILSLRCIVNIGKPYRPAVAYGSCPYRSFMSSPTASSSDHDRPRATAAMNTSSGSSVRTRARIEAAR